MQGHPFKALMLYQTDGSTHSTLETLESDRLPPGEVLIEVEHSARNYKDALGRDIPLHQVPEYAEALLAGRLHRRVVVDVRSPTTNLR